MLAPPLLGGQAHGVGATTEKSSLLCICNVLLLKRKHGEGSLLIILMHRRADMGGGALPQIFGAQAL